MNVIFWVSLIISLSVISFYKFLNLSFSTALLIGIPLLIIAAFFLPKESQETRSKRFVSWSYRKLALYAFSFSAVINTINYLILLQGPEKTGCYNPPSLHSFTQADLFSLYTNTSNIINSCVKYVYLNQFGSLFIGFLTITGAILLYSLITFVLLCLVKYITPRIKTK